MTIYPGNLSLPAETKDRILTTLKQSIALQKEGRGEEAASGCEFMLRLDPQFTPAKKLLEKIKNPAAAIDLDKLIPPSGDRLAPAREALAGRDFQKAINLSTEILTSDFANEEASRIASDARDKMEAAPFIDQFIRKAEARLAEKDREGARAFIKKAQALDSEHPGIAKLEARLSQPIAPSLEQPRSMKPPSPSDSIPMSFDFGTDQSSSFVVDPAAKPASPPVSDFGFTFEEEKKEPASGFSFDSPAGGAGSAAGATSPGSFDFSTASVETTPEDQARIAQYIADGDAAFEKEQYQEAIDLWSRVFLVDVTHEAASERIEKAKRKRLEIEGKVDALMSSAIGAYDRRDFDGARRRFQEVLAFDPSNYSATDYIERLDSASTSAAGAALGLGTPAPRADLFADDFGDAAAVEGITAPPAPSARGKAASAVSSAEKKSSKGLVIAILALVVLGGGGFFLYSKFLGGPKIDATQTEATIREAQSMAGRKRFDEAIAMLSGIKPEDPMHDRAMELIADFKNRKAQASSMIGNQTNEVAYNDLLTKAKASMDSFDFLSAKKFYEEASLIKPLPPDAKVNYDMASQGMAKLDSAMVFFKEGNYRGAVDALEDLSRQDPQNQSIKQLLANAHFNLGKVALESENLADAVVEFDQVLRASPADEIAKRSRNIAERYKGQPKDLLYRIYVKYLPLR